MPHWALALLFAIGQFSQTSMGELRLSVADPAGLPLPGEVELSSDSSELRLLLETDVEGRVTARRLPFGRYRVQVDRSGFSAFSSVVDIQSALPADYPIVLSLASLQAGVTVSATAADTLIDPRRTSASHRIGAATLEQRTTVLAGRALPDLVNAQPGWLLEANGILHPRGSEYQTQYVVDGLPLTDNRSPAFAPEVGAGDVESMHILTGGYPAEYGRKLGGLIEVVTTPQARRGAGGSAALSAGRFDTAGADVLARYGFDRSSAGFSLSTATTGRYLDPPVEENFTNRGATSNASIHVEHDLSASNRLGAIVRHGRANFLVPNERVQDAAGQRQDRRSEETALQVSYQRILSSRAVGDLRGMLRDVSAELWSNPASTPIVAEQRRGFREVYLKGTVTTVAGAHEIKAGIDVVAGSVREQFGYVLTAPDVFDPETPPAFHFNDRRQDREQSAFVQDQMRRGPWTVQAGLRWDRYRLAVSDSALSPRLAAAWSRPDSGVVVRASFDRAFQTPAIENLLLASSSAFAALGDESEIVRLPVPASRGNFYETGISTRVASRARLDVSWFRRVMRDVADDDVLLNTGVGFPIAFSRAAIRGAEVKVDVLPWHGLSGWVGYSHLRGVGELPVTGGLFLGEDAIEGLESRARFPITQDQRHTVRGRVSYAYRSGGWVALAWAYGSGLPFEDFDEEPDEALEQFGRRVVARADFERGRVRPNASIDLSAGVVLAEAARRRLRLQAEVRNLTNRLDVINFAGLFSGTALAPPRSVAVRLRAEF